MELLSAIFNWTKDKIYWKYKNIRHWIWWHSSNSKWENWEELEKKIDKHFLGG